MSEAKPTTSQWRIAIGPPEGNCSESIPFGTRIADTPRSWAFSTSHSAIATLVKGNRQTESTYSRSAMSTYSRSAIQTS